MSRSANSKPGLIGRRSFLRAAGGAAIALPFLESHAVRGAPSVPKRLVIYQTGEGNLPNRWTPQALANNQLMLSEMLQPLASMQSKINVLSGVGNYLPGLHTSNGHNATGHTILTANVIDTTGNGQFDPNIECAASMRCLGPSIDHYLANRLGVMEPLNLAIGSSDAGENRMFYKVQPPGGSGANPEAPLNDDPVDAFNTNLVGLQGGTSTRQERFQARRTNILNGTMDSFATLRRKVSSDDKQRLDAHLAAIADLDKTLNYVPPIECGGLTQDVPPGFEVPGWPEYAQMDVQADMMIDVAVKALSCGARQIVTFQDTQYDGPKFEFLPVGPVDGWHAQVHNDPSLGLGYSSNNDNPTLRAGFLHYASVFAKLLAAMDSGPLEANGLSLLDNSVVLWISEFGWGQTHDPMDLPIVMAGGAQGRIATNRHLVCNGRTTGDLFTSILNAFDIGDTSFGYTGMASLNKGPIPGLVT